MRAVLLSLPLVGAWTVDWAREDDDEPTWTFVAGGNLRASDLANGLLSLRSHITSEQLCAEECASLAECNSYTWMFASTESGCPDSPQCWVRADSVWQPGSVGTCPGTSGHRREPIEWSLVNMSNVYQNDYQQSSTKIAGKFDTEQECRDACASDETCNSYTWTPGNNPGKSGCSYKHQCWIRSDTVWHPKVTSKCAGMSGFKGEVPTPPSPSPPGPSPGPPPTPAPPGALNVLFIIFDDLRINSKSYGLSQPVMPNFDELAARSMTFTRAYVNQAVCGPSRASLLSGRRPDSTQMWNFVGGFRETPGADAWRTWPEYFSSKGWTAYGVGKLYHPGNPKNFDIGRSWDFYGGYNGQGSCPKDASWTAPNSRHGCAMAKGADSSGQPDEETLVTAKAYLSQAKAAWTEQGKPFWLGVGFVRPHMPQVFPAEYLAKVPDLADIAIAKCQHSPNGTSAMEWGTGAEESEWQKPFDEDTQRAFRRGYYAAAAYSDALMGELLGELEKQGLQNDTIVVVTADHGWGLGEHNHWIKYTNWETDARVPLVVHHPKRSATWGTKQAAIVEHVDLYPTTVELAGGAMDKEESIEGLSYASLFEGKGDRFAGAAAYTQYPRCCSGSAPYDFTKNNRCANVKKQDFTYMGYSVRTAEWRYTEFALWNGGSLKPIWNASVPSALSELYDHRRDDGTGEAAFDDFENVNLAFEPEYKQVVATLSKQMRDHFDGSEQRLIV